MTSLPPHSTRAVFLLSAGIFLVCALFALLTQFNGLYGQDAYAYARYAEEVHAWLQGGPQPAPYFWPVGYPLMAALLRFLLPDTVLCLQIVSLLAHALLPWYLWKILQHTALRTAPLHTGLLVAAVACFPYLMRMAPLAMADAAGTTTLVAGLYYALAYGRSARALHLALCAFTLCLSFLCRYGHAVPAAIPAGWVVWHMLRQRRWLHILAGLAGILPLLLPHFLLKNGSDALPDHVYLHQWSLLNAFRHQFTTPDGHLDFGIPNLVFAGQLLAPWWISGLTLLAAGISRSSRAHRQPVSTAQYLALGMALAYALFLLGIPFQNLRFLNACVPLLVILAAPDALTLPERLPAGLQRAVPPALALLVLAFLAASGLGSRKLVHACHLDQAMAAHLQQYPGRTLYTLGPGPALLHYKAPVRLPDIWQDSIPGSQPGDLLLVNLDGRAGMWRDLPISGNLMRIQAGREKTELHTFSPGWTLYELR